MARSRPWGPGWRRSKTAVGSRVKRLGFCWKRSTGRRRGAENKVR
eukprot:CAMPEP_0196575704 /NCGR_PEP_ID=MMETSP1081-20130531/5133_1 /TAXON_ID=36882 /ORGANISM="Pyramimonas amylifera, Strain CCMP720" /LENGTH=44 /DNA_ID= /DNA_START= /DNA_END= /DNA_ORIENTATION=